MYQGEIQTSSGRALRRVSAATAHRARERLGFEIRGADYAISITGAMDFAPQYQVLLGISCLPCGPSVPSSFGFHKATRAPLMIEWGGQPSATRKAFPGLSVSRRSLKLRLRTLKEGVTVFWKQFTGDC